MRALGIKDFSEYEIYLRKNDEELAKLVETITINLSYFFRNLETFFFLKDYIFPEFKKKKDQIVLWSAGCAQGEEPYSLATGSRSISLSANWIKGISRVGILCLCKNATGK